MSASSRDTADALLEEIGAELAAITQQVNDGFDVAPARRARVEGMAAAALTSGLDAQQLLEFCRLRLPADAQVILQSDRRALQLDVWQRRAPVYTTTAD